VPSSPQVGSKDDCFLRRRRRYAAERWSNAAHDGTGTVLFDAEILRAVGLPATGVLGGHSSLVRTWSCAFAAKGSLWLSPVDDLALPRWRGTLKDQVIPHLPPVHDDGLDPLFRQIHPASRSSTRARYT